MKARRGNGLDTVPFQPYFGCTDPVLPFLDSLILSRKALDFTKDFLSLLNP